MNWKVGDTIYCVGYVGPYVLGHRDAPWGHIVAITEYSIILNQDWSLSIWANWEKLEVFSED